MARLTVGRLSPVGYGGKASRTGRGRTEDSKSDLNAHKLQKALYIGLSAAFSVAGMEKTSVCAIMGIYGAL